MGSFILWAIIAVAVVAFLNKVVQAYNKTGEKMQGRSRCEDCGSRLKAVKGSYRGRCRKCGTTQSWA